jgi:hypothetical protein
MKAVNAGLLVVGAAIAGGIAFRLTEPPPIPVSVTAPRVQAAPPQNTPPVTVQTPPAVTRWRAAIASAPPPVYTEPAPPPPLSHPMRPPVVVAKVEPKPIPVPVPYEAPPPPEPKPEPPARHVTLQAGDRVAVRMAEPISAERMKVGEIFSGALAEPLIAEGLVVGERGAKVSGRVIAINREALTLRLLNFQTADGQRIEISTEPVTILSGNILRFRLAAKIVITERKT